MTLESQVCSLDLAKRLKGLGVKQESYFNWAKIKQEPKTSWIIDKNAVTLPEVDYYSAFTVAELGEMLPVRDGDKNFTYKRAYAQEKGFYWLIYGGEDNEKMTANTEADARAKLLIHLLENKLIAL